MNYIDLTVAVIIVVFVLFGFFKKFYRNFFAVTITVLAFPIGYFLEQKYYSSIMEANISVLTSRSGSSIFNASSLNEILTNVKNTDIWTSVMNYSPTFASMADQWVTKLSELLIAFLMVVIIMLLSGLLSYIIGLVFGIFLGKTGRKKKILKLSIPLSFIRGLAVSIAFVLPFIFIAPSLAALKNSSNETAISAYSFYTDNIKESLIIKTFGPQLSDIFIKDDVTSNGETDSTSSQLAEGLKIYSDIEPLANEFSAFSDVSLAGYDTLLDSVDRTITIADSTYLNLSENSIYRTIIIEILNNGLAEDDSGMFTGIEFDENDVESLKDDVVPVIMTKVFNKLLLDSGIDITLPDGISYAELMTEIRATNRAYFAALELSKLQDLTLLPSMDTDAIVLALQSLSQSEYSEVLLDRITDEFTGDNSGLAAALSTYSMDELANQAENVGTVLDILTGATSPSPSDTVDAIAESSIAIDMLKITDKTIPLSEEDYDDTMDIIDFKDGLSLEDKATIKNLFTEEVEN